jgi:acyl-ACP thioesterase
LENYFEKQFELRYFEMNKFGEASPTHILTLLEETAADHCYAIDHSLYELEKQNIGWILLSGIMEMDRYPVYKEKITIRTWLSRYSAIRGYRENILFDEKRNIIGRSRGLWIFLDIKKRKPVRIFDDIKERWSCRNEECIDHDITQKIESTNSSVPSREFKANWFDVDMYNHVNNIKYLQWLLESTPVEIIDNFYLKSIDGRFISEAKYGDTILSFTEMGKSDNSFVHTIKTSGNNTVCATAKTLWEPRG